MSKTKKKSELDMPELLSRLQVLKFNIDVLEKDLKREIDGLQILFGIDEAELKTKVNAYLNGLEYFVNTSFKNKIDWFKVSARQIKKAGNLN